MKQGICPYSGRSSHAAVRSNILNLNNGVDSGGSRSKIDQYSYYGYLTEGLQREKGDLLRKYLENIFKKGMSLEEFLEAVKKQYHTLIEKVVFPETLDAKWIGVNHGIGTMFTILQAIFRNNPNISKKKCLELCRKIMREAPIRQLPQPDGKIPIREKYQVFINKVIEDSILYQKDKDALYCPAIYTKGGNELLSDIVDAIYKHFPQIGVDDDGTTSSPRL